MQDVSTLSFNQPEDFYNVYDRHRTYVKAELRKKHIRDFTANIWQPGAFTPGMRVLELGCGVGLFLAYLRAMKAGEAVGVEMDPKAKEFMPPDLAALVHTTTFDDYLSRRDLGRFDRIVMLDVFEHFSPAEGVDLLRRFRHLLSPGGKLIVRVPNMASPWGMQYQYNDLTHKGFYAPGNIRQLALAAGWETEACLPSRRGSTIRRLLDTGFEKLMNKVLTDPPPVWTANFIAVLRPQQV
jgi:Cyclopropane fatty acid synthase and related methyltransferases